MRTKQLKPLFVIASSMLALTALTACGGGDATGGSGGTGSAGVDKALGDPTGGGDGTGQGGGDGDGTAGTGVAGLPKAGTMAGAVQLVSTFTPCDDLSTDPNDDDFFGGDENYDATWSVTERGACDHGLRIFMFKDLKTFETKYKAEMDEDRKESPNQGHRGKFLVGQDFAVLPDRKSAIRYLLSPGGPMILNCFPGFNPPSGYRKDPTPVDGCFLTNYFED
ncbi:hypothetical protein [Streptomyces sp. NPDC004788]